jgi:membrane protease YdiL (CAAX protease family)
VTRVEDAYSEEGTYLDNTWREPNSRLRYLLLVVLVMLTFTLLGGLVVLPVTAGLPDSEVGALLRNLLPFVGALALLWLLARFLMRRPLWTFAMPTPGTEWGLFSRGVIIQLVCLGLGTLVFSLSPIGSLDVSAPDWSLLAVLAPIALLGFAIQAGVEEIVFRGIWPQAVRRFTGWIVLVYGFPALVFASLHVGNVSALGDGGLALLPYFLTACLWGWVSYRTGSLWLSWGMHYANNIYLVLLIGSHDDVATPVSGLAFVYAHPDAQSVLTTSLSGTALSAVAVWVFVLRSRPVPMVARS